MIKLNQFRYRAIEPITEDKRKKAYKRKPKPDPERPKIIAPAGNV